MKVGRVIIKVVKESHDDRRWWKLIDVERWADMVVEGETR